jgi:hypothetical protein
LRAEHNWSQTRAPLAASPRCALSPTCSRQFVGSVPRAGVTPGSFRPVAFGFRHWQSVH